MHPDFTAKQVAFMRSYIVCRNATQAAIDAGYAANSAGVTGSKLLKNAKVKAAIAEVDARIAEKQNVKAEEVIAQYKAIAMANMFDFLTYDADGIPQFDLKMVEQNRRELGGAIKTLNIKRTMRRIPGTEDRLEEVDIKVGLEARMPALEALNAATGALAQKNVDSTPKVVINVNTGIPGPPGSKVRKMKVAEPVVAGEITHDND